MTSAPVVDSSVIRRARNSDPQALGQIWRAYHAPVLRYLRGLGVEDPEDVASDVWESVARSLRRFEGDGNDLRRWLFTIARRRRIDHLRRTGRSLEDLVETLPEASASDDAEAATGHADAITLLRRLPPARAEVVLLRVLGGFSVEETAEITGRSPGAVRVMAHRALAELRAQIMATEPARADA